jgi:hypothetical protein
MNQEIETVKESAKAIKEVAKTTGKAIDAGEKFGGFISKFISCPIEQCIGIFEDKLKYMRWERQLRLIKRADALMEGSGPSGPSRAIPLKIAIPLFQAASLEDDDYLQDLWAKLLVNGANADSGIDLKKAYIDILEQLTPLEAKILEKLYQLPFKETQHNGIRTDGLPSVAKPGMEKENKSGWAEPSEEVLLSLLNLARVGCVSPARTWGGGENFSSVNPTLLGKRFIEACTLNSVMDI